MASSESTSAGVWEDGGATCLARVRGADGNYITQASLIGITYKAFDLSSSTPDTATSTGTVSIASSVFDTLQTDSMWTTDDTGYNYRHTIPASVLATGDHVYRVEYKFDSVSGEDFFLVFELLAQAIRSS